MKSFKDKVIAITGAGDGIGRALAYAAGEKGALLALSDIDSDRLEETRATCESKGFQAIATPFDVAEKSAVDDWAAEVNEHYGRVNAIVNNAGVSLTVPIAEMSLEDFEWLMDINFWGVVHGTRAFLPLLKASGDGHVVNISSIFGIIAVPGQSAYNASKFAVRGYTEALAAELDIEKAKVVATVVHPGGVKTGIVRRARYGGSNTYGEPEKLKRDFDTEMAKTTPEQAAQQIVRGMLKGKRRIMVGTDAKLISIGQRVLPTGYLKVVAAEMKRRMK